MHTCRQNNAKGSCNDRSGFTLLEILVSVTILAILMLVLTTAVSNSRDLWLSTSQRVSEFREGRAAMEAMSRRLSQATLNSYWGYDDPDDPKLFQRQSELHFVCGPSGELLGDGNDARKYTGSAVFFQAPFGYAGTEAGSLGEGADFDDMDDLLNCWGYFVEYSSDIDPDRPLRPAFLEAEVDLYPERKRFRLMEFRQPSERLEIYSGAYSGRSGGIDLATSTTTLYKWFRFESVQLENSRPIAENILAVVIRPQAPTAADQDDASKSAIAPDYYYDTRRHQWEGGSPISAISRNQLPPVIEMTLVALEEKSFDRYIYGEGEEKALELVTFVNSRFKSTSNYEEDMEELEEELIKRSLDYRLFTISVPIRAAKFVTTQES